MCGEGSSASVAKCRGSWVEGRGRGSWAWVVGVGRGCGSWVWVWVNVVGKKKKVFQTK